MATLQKQGTALDNNTLHIQLPTSLSKVVIQYILFTNIESGKSEIKLRAVIHCMSFNMVGVRTMLHTISLPDSHTKHSYTETQ